MTVSAFEPPPDIGTVKLGPMPRFTGNPREDLMKLRSWLLPLANGVILTEEDLRDLRSWMERYTKQVTDET